ncbi:MAG: hypothetical protein E5V74_03215 [Mesorhizobium sp.]|uniref:hypothetical protein n=1 Tax=unclassified Mesorhizobium TaxID=325217 RepID=UPI001093D5D6|nr:MULTISPECIES: hypothetical protein [unclassified Mesorhizobium]TGS85158.1 hypothetical protein EN818_22165 [Mesorhizobium sp. M3A.F.Ca.ET.175.01.1.1]TGT23147.1 hypothetical protein EN817_24080 [Mesorhizobium sp. M3A.F.Ca.ET.174.01.1.1]TIU12627.1 MAG: hypothetical protein E5W44_06595 [Mesorhizobium sp.]TIW05370.1 MAG: hypothetical protein E5V74_03215 [Mesorhizobium sp.]
MRQHWHIKPLPPPDDSADRPDGFVGFALLALIVIGPLILFGHELGAMETWLVDVYKAVESWLLPVRDWFLG